METLCTTEWYLCFSDRNLMMAADHTVANKVECSLIRREVVVYSTGSDISNKPKYGDFCNIQFILSGVSKI